MTPSRNEVDALVLAGGQGRRLGLGPKVLLDLAGRSLLRRALDVVLPFAGRVIVGVPADLVDLVRSGCPDHVLVLAGGTSRLDTLRTLFAASAAPFVIQHDVVHPFVTTAMVRAVVNAARRSGAAMAVVEEGGHAFSGRSAIERRLIPDGPLMLARKPIACSRALLASTLTSAESGRDDDGSVERMLQAGVAIEAITVPPWNLKITGPDDWVLAQALAPMIDGGRLAS